MKKVLFVVLVVAMLLLSLPVFASPAEPNYASHLYVTVRQYHSSWEDAPDTIYVIRWINGMLYSGEIEKFPDSWNGISIIYAGYIYPDESVTPNHAIIPALDH